MDHDPDDLIHGYLDDRLDTEQLRALNDWLKQDPDHARRFALAVLLHDRLRDRFRAEDEPRIGAEVRAAAPASPRRWRRRSVLVATAAVGLVAALALFLNMSDRRAGAAEAALARLIETTGRPGDRTYRIVALDGGREMQRSGDAGPRGMGRERPPIHGALLHVRGDRQYVLVRLPGEPGEFVTGCDGREAWSVPPKGPVHVSRDVARFRGAVPGEQQGLPFLDLGSALGRLRDAYVLTLGGDPSAAVRLFRAHKRSAAHRGPRDVSVWFDARSGVILRMQMDGLPQVQGGPRSLALQLIDQRDLGPAFFGHAAHHDPDRPMTYELP